MIKHVSNSPSFSSMRQGPTSKIQLQLLLLYFCQKTMYVFRNNFNDNGSICCKSGKVHPELFSPSKSVNGLSLCREEKAPKYLHK